MLPQRLDWRPGPARPRLPLDFCRSSTSRADTITDGGILPAHAKIDRRSACFRPSGIRICHPASIGTPAGPLPWPKWSSGRRPRGFWLPRAALVSG